MTPRSDDDDYDCDYQDVDYDYQDDDDNYVPLGWYEKKFDNNDDNNKHTREREGGSHLKDHKRSQGGEGGSLKRSHRITRSNVL